VARCHREADAALRLGLLGGVAGFAATALGALPALFLRGLSSRTEDTMLGLAAGMMLAASSFSLILPGLPPANRSPATPRSAHSPWWRVSARRAADAGLDQFTPHEHEHLGATVQAATG